MVIFLNDSKIILKRVFPFVNLFYSSAYFEYVLTVESFLS